MLGDTSNVRVSPLLTRGLLHFGSGGGAGAAGSEEILEQPAAVFGEDA